MARGELPVHTQTVNSWPKMGHAYVKILSIVPIDMCPMDTFWKAKNNRVVEQFPHEYLTFK